MKRKKTFMDGAAGLRFDCRMRACAFGGGGSSIPPAETKRALSEEVESAPSANGTASSNAGERNNTAHLWEPDSGWDLTRSG
ncbi:MAG: hypothetical protein V8R78_00625 [Evtepia gabavorous]